MVVMANDTWLPMKQIGDVVITSRTSSQQVKVKNAKKLIMYRTSQNGVNLYSILVKIWTF